MGTDKSKIPSAVLNRTSTQGRDYDEFPEDFTEPVDQSKPTVPKSQFIIVKKPKEETKAVLNRNPIEDDFSDVDQDRDDDDESIKTEREGLQ